MDQSSYDQYIVLLDKHILKRIGTFYRLFTHILNTKHKYAYHLLTKDSVMQVVLSSPSPC